MWCISALRCKGLYVLCACALYGRGVRALLHPSPYPPKKLSSEIFMYFCPKMLPTLREAKTSLPKWRNW